MEVGSFIKCKHCDYKWMPRKPVVIMCPRCKSRRWNQPKHRKPSVRLPHDGGKR